MTGPEHYREAENLLAMANEQVVAIVAGDPTAGGEGEPAFTIAEAQVHATLALAAATALNDNDGGMQRADWSAWLDVASLTDREPSS